MGRWLRWMSVVGLWIALVAGAGKALAGEPAYLVLRPPSRTAKGQAKYSGRGYEVKTNTYAYGWFGAPPRRHWRRSTGFYSGYIQWSKR